jgi:hypothetical protein
MRNAVKRGPGILAVKALFGGSAVLAAQETGAGHGHDVRFGRRFALAPFANFVQLFSEGDPGRNQGEPARGPSNPRYAQLGLGFHWY